MTKIATSSSFYSRGIDKKYHSFGYLVQANYTVVNPQNLYYFGFLRNISGVTTNTNTNTNTNKTIPIKNLTKMKFKN
jgi:hypothetical protein